MDLINSMYEPLAGVLQNNKTIDSPGLVSQKGHSFFLFC